MPELKGEAKHFHHKYKFQLNIDGMGSLQYKSMSELKADVAKIEYYEGGVIVPYKEAGRLSFPDITIERAATDDADMYNWLLETARASTNWGAIFPKYKRGGHIIQLDRDNVQIRTWQLYGLFPISFTAGAWDNTSDEMTIEQLVLAIDYFEAGINIRRVMQEVGVGTVSGAVVEKIKNSVG